MLIFVRNFLNEQVRLAYVWADHSAIGSLTTEFIEVSSVYSCWGCSVAVRTVISGSSGYDALGYEVLTALTVLTV